VNGWWFVGWTLFVGISSFFVGCWTMIDHYEKERGTR
jgi:hypothetical protein